MSTEIHSTVWKAKELLAEIKHVLPRTIIYIFLTEGREANSVCHFRKSVDFGRKKNLLCHIFLKVPITPILFPSEETIIITTAHAFFINTKKYYTKFVLRIIIF